MSNLPRTDILAAEEESFDNCPHCGARIRLAEKGCLCCLLSEGLEAEGEASREAFERVLSEADVPDQHWRLGQYEILEEIGRGGMGVIYRARQRYCRRIVAVKRVLAYQSDSRETLLRFRREAEAAASLDHINILPIYEVSESEDGRPFFSMKYATGGSLRGALPALRTQPNESISLMAKVARAMAYAHGQGILHRDLQPGNILLDGKGDPLVSDFGLAKRLYESSDLTRTLTTFGTPGYIAPEQAECAAADLTPGADIYSLGAILFHLLAGRPPFIGENALTVIQQASVSPAPRLRTLVPSFNRDLEIIVARCLERTPEARYRSAAALAEDLERHLDGRPILARPVLFPARLWRWSRRNPLLSATAATCLILTIALLGLLQGRLADQPAFPQPEKSIAVLPFEDLGGDKANAAFAAGIQDDMLTSLAQIHELKVISRTSMLSYQEKMGRKIREIGRALGVANVLEGTVRRSGDRVILNVQLIDTRSDRHLWAQRYDRTVVDSMGLQGELATQIAVALKTTLAPGEKARLDAGPTTNSEAYVLYLTALGKEATDKIAAEQLYVQATTIDPKFALAYARASLLNSDLAGYEQPRRKAKARAQAEEALRLSPTLGEAHMALGLCLFWAEKKYDAALKEFEAAAKILPNNAQVYEYVGGIYRRYGRWRDAVSSFDRALSLDPRNVHLALAAANNHLFMRDWEDAGACFKLALNLDSPFAPIGLAYLEVFKNNNPAAGRNVLRGKPPDNDWRRAEWDLAMIGRDYSAAKKILDDFPSQSLGSGEASNRFYQGQTALARGDTASAQGYFDAAKPAFEAWVRDDPANPEKHAWLGLLYAYMHRKEEALRESRQAMELEPETRNAFHGTLWAANRALVFALVGEQNEAITLIERLLLTPGPVPWPNSSCSMTLAELRLRWEWDSLRSNPRFQKILTHPEPKPSLTSITPPAEIAPKDR